MKKAWSSRIGEVLLCKRERINPHGPFAVAICKEDSTVGHIPRTISSVCCMFLRKPGSSISCRVTGPRRYSHDLPQGGMEIPCTIEFKGYEIYVNKLKWIIAQQKENREACASHLQTKINKEKSDSLSTNSSVGTALNESQHASVQIEVENPRCASVNISIQKSAVKMQSAAPGPSIVTANVLESPHTSVNVKFMDTFQGNETKTIDVDGNDKSNAESQYISPNSLNIIAIEHNYSQNPVETPHLWVRFGKSFLTTQERDQINYGK